MTLNEAIQTIAANPDAPLSSEVQTALRDTLRRHPYCVLPAALLLRGAGISDNERAGLQARVAVLTADKDALASLAAAPGADPASFYPAEEPATPVSTDSAIDTFLDTYGRTSPEEEQLLERLIFNPVPEYADLLGAEDTPLDSISIEDLTTPPAAEKPEPARPQTRPAGTQETAEQSDSPLSESLARIFISRGRYERALEILTDLAERFPDRNPFYADQARYLRKLVRLKNLQA